MDITQQKLVHPDESPRTWIVNPDVIQRHISWARRDPDALVEEMEEMKRFFPSFITSITNPGEGFAECPNCGNLIIVADRFECVACEREYPPHPSALLGFVGRLVFNIGTRDGERLRGRPFLKSVDKRIEEMDEGDERDIFNSYFIYAKDTIYFAPPVLAVYASSGPSTESSTYLSEYYFRILDIPVAHTAGENIRGHYRLCNFSHYHKQPLRMVLQSRVLPRIGIDLIIADLKIVGKLDRVLQEVGGMHDIYNTIGRPQKGERLQHAFNRYVNID